MLKMSKFKIKNKEDILILIAFVVCFIESLLLFLDNDGIWPITAILTFFLGMHSIKVLINSTQTVMES